MHMLAKGAVERTASSAHDTAWRAVLLWEQFVCHSGWAPGAVERRPGSRPVPRLVDSFYLT